MPTLAIILLVYYAAVMLYDVARGSRTVRIEGWTAALPLVTLVTTALTITGWLSLPFCGGVPALVWVAVGLITFEGTFGALCVIGYIGRTIEIRPSTLVVQALIFGFYAVVLLTTGYCA